MRVRTKPMILELGGLPVAVDYLVLETPEDQRRFPQFNTEQVGDRIILTITARAPKLVGYKLVGKDEVILSE